MLTHVDTTTVYSALMDVTGNGKSTWGRNSTFDVTVSSLLLNGVRIPPVPRQKAGPAASTMGLVLDRERGLVKGTGYRTAARDGARRDTNSALSCSRQTKRLRSLIDGFRTDPEYKHWMDWHIGHEMEDHILRVEGITQPQNVPVVARILGREPATIEAINAEAYANPKAFVRKMNPLDDTASAFTADVVVRGFYYDFLARHAGRQRIHHVVRRRALDDVPSVEVAFELPQVVGHVAAIIRNLARAKWGDTARVAEWIRLTKEARAPLRAFIRRSSIRDAMGEDARQLAITFATQAGLSTQFSVAEGCAEYGGSLVGALLLYPFGAVVGRKAGKGFNKVVTRPLSRSQLAMKRFSEPGRVRTTIEIRRQ